jgi:hypothetical protein
MTKFSFREAHLLQGEFAEIRWSIVGAPDDLPLAALLEPETWAHISAKFNQKPGQYDEIIVKPLGLPYRAHLVVLEGGKNFAKVRLLDVTRINMEAGAFEAAKAALETPAGAELPADAPLFVKFESPATRYCVFRRSDRERLRAGFAVKEEANDWARQHALSMAA